MGFASGSVSCRRLRVVAREKFGPSEELLDLLRSHTLKPTELGVPGEVEYGWSGGRHLFDGAFSFEHNVFGETVLFAMRVDTHIPPADLKRAYQALEEEAALAESPSGFLSKAQKRDIKDAVQRKLEDELREGRHRRSKLVPVLWDTARNLVLSPATGGNLEKLRELFERTFGAELEPMGAGAAALFHLESAGKRRDYEDLRPTRFALGPEGQGQVAEYPWAAKGPEPKDFLGNEFLLWMWHTAETRGGVIELPDRTDVAVLFDRTLDLDCVYGQTGRDALRGDCPTRMPEARDALRSGKVPRKAGLILEVRGDQLALTLGAESLSISSARLPEPPAADDARPTGPRETIETRLEHLATLFETLDTLYQGFLKLRCSSSWETWTSQCRKWITASAPLAPHPRVSVEIHPAARQPDRRPAREPIEDTQPVEDTP